MVTGNTSPDCSDCFDAADLAFDEERASIAWENAMDTSVKRPSDDQDQGDEDLDESGDTGPRPSRQRTAADGAKILSVEEIHTAESLAVSIANSVVVQSSSVSASQPSQPSSASQATEGVAQATVPVASDSGGGAGSGGKPKQPVKQQHKNQAAPRKGGQRG